MASYLLFCVLVASCGFGCQSGPVAGDITWEYVGNGMDIKPLPEVTLRYKEDKTAAVKLQSGCIRWDWVITVITIEQEFSIYQKQVWYDTDDGTVAPEITMVRVPPEPSISVPANIRREVHPPVENDEAKLWDYPVEIEFQVVSDLGVHWRKNTDSALVLAGKLLQPSHRPDREMYLCESQLQELLSYPVSSYQILVRPTIRGEHFTESAVARRLDRSTIKDALAVQDNPRSATKTSKSAPPRNENWRTPDVE